MQFRKTEREVAGAFVRCEFEALKPGERFRLCDGDGTLVAIGICNEIPFPVDPPGNWQFDATLDPVQ